MCLEHFALKVENPVTSIIPPAMAMISSVWAVGLGIDTLTLMGLCLS